MAPKDPNNLSQADELDDKVAASIGVELARLIMADGKVSPEEARYVAGLVGISNPDQKVLGIITDVTEQVCQSRLGGREQEHELNEGIGLAADLMKGLRDKGVAVGEPGEEHKGLPGKGQSEGLGR